MITVGINEKKLYADITKMAKKFGDTTEQATCRLGVAAAKNFAISTQAFGKANKAKPMQFESIHAGMTSVVLPLDGLKISKKTVSGITANGKRITFPRSRYLGSIDEINRFVDMHQSKRTGRTPETFPIEKMGCARKTIFNKAFIQRKKKAGIAKGGWIGAGKKAASLQRGGEKLNVDKSFLGYTHKFSNWGTARKSGGAINPQIELINNVPYSSTKGMLRPSLMRGAISLAVKNTLTWYRKTLRERAMK